MEFMCPKCNKTFRPHTFIAMRHPSQAKCPICGSKGRITEQGAENRKSRFHAINQANAEAAERFSAEIKALKG